MDDPDRAFLDSLLPEGAVPQGFIAVAAWVEADGAMRWRCYNQLDLPISGCLGLLELAKLDLVNRCSPLPIARPTEDDD